MDQQQYGEVMRMLGGLKATQDAQGQRQDNLMTAIDALETRYDKHLSNDHAHLNGRRSKRETALVVGKVGGGGFVVYTLLETLSRIFLG